MSPLVDLQEPQLLITDTERITAILASPAFASPGWRTVDEESFVPLYSIDIAQKDGTSVRYWLGASSHPPRFPCYSLCSGWWVGVLPERGERLRKALTSVVYSGLLSELFPDRTKEITRHAA